MKKINKLIISICMMMALVLVSGDVSEAKVSVVPDSRQIEEVQSSEKLQEEYYKVTTPFDEESVIYIEGRTKVPTERFCIRLFDHASTSNRTYYMTVFVKPDENGEFAIVADVSEGNTIVPAATKGTVSTAEEAVGSRPGRNAVQEMDEGYYHLTIARAKTVEEGDVTSKTWYKGPMGGSYGYCFKEATLEVAEGEYNNPKLIEYPVVLENNKKLKDAKDINGYLDATYTDKYMKDYNSLLFVNPRTSEKTYLTAEKVAYLEKAAASITKDAKDDYERLLKIYEYVAGNVYYDQYAYETKMYQFDDPYHNIYYLRNKKTPTYNTNNKKVATVCQGYAGMVVALARAEGIPARICNGHHLSYPTKIWSDKTGDQISRYTHWWAEAYVDGRWIIIDANEGSGNKWEREYFKDSGDWNYRGIDTYLGFDPSPEILANCYSYNTVRAGGGTVDTLKNEKEISQMKKFLNKTSSGISNGKRMNDRYNPENPTSWGTGEEDNLVLNSSGRVTEIRWQNNKLYGAADFSDYAYLKKLYIYGNKLTELDVDGCDRLTYASAGTNNLKEFDGTGAPKLSSIRLKGNKLTSARFIRKSKEYAIKRKTSVGSFSFIYAGSTGKLTIYANSNNIPSGYKYLKIYDGTKLKKTINVSGRSSYSYTFTPSSSSTVCSIQYTKSK